MKFMRLGTRPDTFYTEEATRTILGDLPSDLTICINNTTYLLHKFPLVPKCGLLQRLCSDKADSMSATLELHDIPGGEDAFELCAKFCYGITIVLGAHKFLPAICAAKFLRMTESVEKGNFVSKLEFFFYSYILQGWKDSIITLQTTAKFPEWSENLGIIRRCIDSIVEKILTPLTKVTWSYTYTRAGYAQKKHHRSAPKDWWTEDITDLDVELFSCILNTVRSTNRLPPQLIGEALHVYASRWLQPHQTSTSSSTSEELSLKRKRQLETIVSLIPGDRGSVSLGFLLKLLSMAKFFGASSVIKTQLIKKCSLQLEEATPQDLLFHIYDIDLVRDVLESFFRQPYNSREDQQSAYVIMKVGKLIDSYLQLVAKDANMPVHKVVSLAKALPEFARPEHDDVYKAINIYLKEHPEMSKEDKKLLCSVLDCRRLSPGVCAHAVKNERLPLRTVVQVLFFEQERNGSKALGSHGIHQSHNRQITGDFDKRIQLNPGSSTSQKLEPEQKSRRKKIGESEIIRKGSKLDSTKMRMQRSTSERVHDEGR